MSVLKFKRRAYLGPDYLNKFQLVRGRSLLRIIDRLSKQDGVDPSTLAFDDIVKKSLSILNTCGLLHV
ncbi:hypothetical protein [Capybara microvirus Cap1_SP_167]|nr:hypothetical protein [Capybara microvirus Cap1_SP_167]